MKRGQTKTSKNEQTYSLQLTDSVYLAGRSEAEGSVNPQIKGSVICIEICPLDFLYMSRQIQIEKHIDRQITRTAFP